MTPAARVRMLATLGPRILLRAYRLLFSPLWGRNCRYEPSCSRYAEEALERYGLWLGAWYAIRRVGRCHPWNAGGYDPVP